MKRSQLCLENQRNEKLNSDGYTRVKVNKNKWDLKQRVIWEENFGSIPVKHVIIFVDGDKQNFDLDNLVLISRRKLGIINKNRLIKSDSRYTKTGLIIADILLKIADKKKVQN